MPLGENDSLSTLGGKLRPKKDLGDALCAREKCEKAKWLNAFSRGIGNRARASG
jgi:hypothetical protein